MGGQIKVAIVGAGQRGIAYARLAAAAGAQIAAVAEPDADRRARIAAEFAVPADQTYSDWQALAGDGRVADAAFICTQDRLHEGPAVALAGLGYHLMLEKPMAPTEDAATRIVEAVEAAGVLLAVGHVMRYSNYTRTLKALLDADRIGEIVSVEHLEPIGWWHFAHSYVRGNWAREDESSTMLMAKSSHDLDWISYVVGRPVRQISSFGSLFHFTPANKPEGATDRCTDCPLQSSCPYSATLIYERLLDDPDYEQWPLGVLSADVNRESIHEALETTPYGECVYNGHNDVVDHQVVSMEFDNGATASFTACAFTELDFRKSRVFGTRGVIEGDGRTLWHHDFATDKKQTIDTTTSHGASAADGHGGADGELVTAFLRALGTADPRGAQGLARGLLSGPAESLYSHQLVWAAEESRRTGQVVRLPER